MDGRTISLSLLLRKNACVRVSRWLPGWFLCALTNAVTVSAGSFCCAVENAANIAGGDGTWTFCWRCGFFWILALYRRHSSSISVAASIWDLFIPCVLLPACPSFLCHLRGATPQTYVVLLRLCFVTSRWRWAISAFSACHHSLTPAFLLCSLLLAELPGTSVALQAPVYPAAAPLYIPLAPVLLLPSHTCFHRGTPYLPLKVFCAAACIKALLLCTVFM